MSVGDAIVVLFCAAMFEETSVAARPMLANLAVRLVTGDARLLFESLVCLTAVVGIWS